jgi:nucleotide-binding universal stress UspA family protein
MRSGNPYEEIVNAAKELGVGLIVIGLPLKLCWV